MEGMKEISRQRKDQIRRKQAGICRLCPNQTQGRIYCDECAKYKIGIKIRRPLKSQWDAVDWTLPNSEIAKTLNVHYSAVENQRRKAGQPHIFKHRFVVYVRTDSKRTIAELALLSCFALRKPDGCEFILEEKDKE